jgi:hypothetical protein
MKDSKAKFMNVKLGSHDNEYEDYALLGCDAMLEWSVLGCFIFRIDTDKTIKEL